MTAPACPRCESTNTILQRSGGQPLPGRFFCLACVRPFGPNNPPDAGGTGEPARVAPGAVEAPNALCWEAAALIAGAPVPEEPRLDEDIANALDWLDTAYARLPAKETGAASCVTLLGELRGHRAEKREREAERTTAWDDGAEVAVTIEARAVYADDILAALSAARQLAAKMVRKHLNEPQEEHSCNGAIRVVARWNPEVKP